MNPSIIPVSGYRHIRIFKVIREEDESEGMEIQTTPIIAFHYTFQLDTNTELGETQKVFPISAFHVESFSDNDKFLIQDPQGLIIEPDSQTFESIEELKDHYNIV